MMGMQNVDAGTTVKYQGREFVVQSYVDPHPGRKSDEVIPRSENCWKCGGSGYIKAFGFTDSGRCWACHTNGAIVTRPRVSALRREAKVQAVLREYGEQLRAEREAEEAIARAAAAAEQFARDWDAAQAEQERRNALVKGFVGAVGAKLKDLRGTVDVSKVVEGAYGNSVFLVVTLDNGQVVKTFGSGESLWGLDRGQEVLILAATVKDHVAHQGQDQTVLTRVKIGRQ